MEVVGMPEKGRPARRLKDVVENDIRVMSWRRGWQQ